MGERSSDAVVRALALLNEHQRVAEASQITQKLRDEQVPLSGALQI